MSPSAMTLSNGVAIAEAKKNNGSEIMSKPGSLGISTQPSSTGHTNGQPSTSTAQVLNPSADSPDLIHDLICIGFGPASLAIAIALHDTSTPAKALYLENKPRFAWHAGMQLPSAKMQISFLKDLATPRLPTSKFTFLNYLWSVGRLNHFINLGTFLPSRREYEDYLRWCAAFFEAAKEVRYGVEVLRLEIGQRNEEGKVVSWDVVGRTGGDVRIWKAKHVVIAVGGKAVIPPDLQGSNRVFHSSEYASRISQIQESAAESKMQKLKFAVIGSGQSAAEIFNDLWDRFPHAEVKLIIKGASLRPSDDSPFVNEIFDPSRVSHVFSLPAPLRQASITLDKGTNYGVVRLELLEHLYEKMYMQRLANPNEKQWQFQILSNRVVTSTSESKTGSEICLKLGFPQEYLELGGKEDMNSNHEDVEEEALEVDYVFAATGYIRNAHEGLLSNTVNLLPENSPLHAPEFPVERNYRVRFDKEKVDFEKAGIWLQGCNEGTHGLSDTLLSILAVRAGEVVESIFGSQKEA